MLILKIFPKQKNYIQVEFRLVYSKLKQSI